MFAWMNEEGHWLVKVVSSGHVSNKISWKFSPYLNDAYVGFKVPKDMGRQCVLKRQAIVTTIRTVTIVREVFSQEER